MGADRPGQTRERQSCIATSSCKAPSALAVALTAAILAAPGVAIGRQWAELIGDQNDRSAGCARSAARSARRGKAGPSVAHFAALAGQEHFEWRGSSRDFALPGGRHIPAAKRKAVIMSIGFPTSSLPTDVRSIAVPPANGHEGQNVPNELPGGGLISTVSGGVPGRLRMRRRWASCRPGGSSCPAGPRGWGRSLRWASCRCG
jgi:hypothetical protein